MNNPIVFIGTSNQLQIRGKGMFKDTGLDNCKVGIVPITDTDNIVMTCYLKSIDAGNAGIFIRNADITNNTKAGCALYALYIDKDNSQIVVGVRAKDKDFYGEAIKIPALTTPKWLKIEKVGTTVNFYYSSSLESETPDWTKVHTIVQAFSTWTKYQKGIFSGSKTTSYNKSVISKYKNLGNQVVICNDIVISAIEVAGTSKDVLNVTYSSLEAQSVSYVICPVNSTTQLKTGLATALVQNGVRKFSITGISTFQSGNYVLKLTGMGCDGTTSKEFAYSNIVETLVIKSEPSVIRAGVQAVLSTTNATGNVKWYKNGNLVGQGLTLTIPNPTEGDEYTAKQEIGSLVSPTSNKLTVVPNVVGTNQVASIPYNIAPLREDVSTVYSYGDAEVPLMPDGEPMYQTAWIAARRNQLDPSIFFQKSGYTSVGIGNMFEGIEKDQAGVGVKSTLKWYQRFSLRGAETLDTHDGGLYFGHISHGALQGFIDSLPDADKPYGTTLFQMQDYYDRPSGSSYRANVQSHCNSYKGLFNDYDPNSPVIAGVLIDHEMDYDGKYQQDFINTIYALHAYALEVLHPKSRFAICYNNAPWKIINEGQISASSYTKQPNNPIWTQPVIQTDNSRAKGMPDRFQGKYLKDLPDNLLVFTECYYFAQDFYPQNYKLTVPLGTSGYEDGNVYINHFGTTTNHWKHWATAFAFNCEIQKPYIGKKKLVVNTAPFVGGGDGFYFYWHAPTGRLVPPNEFIGNLAVECPTYMMEGIQHLAFFSDAWVTVWWGDTFGSTTSGPNWMTPVPTTKQKYEVLNVAPEMYGGYTELTKDHTQLGGITVASKRLHKTYIKPDGSSLDTISSIVDGNEIYLCENTEVDYLDGQGFRKVKATDWRDYTLSPVRVIINEVRREIAIFAIRAYVNSNEPTQFKVRYNKNGFNFVSDVLTIREQTSELWKFKM